MVRRKTRHEEEAADDPVGRRGDAEGYDLPATPGMPQAAAPFPALEASQVSDDPERHRIRRDSRDSEQVEPWSRSGVPADALVFPAPLPRKKLRTGLLGRLRGSISENGPKNDAPINLRPWTWEILPHVTESREGSPLTRLLDRIAWHTTLPDARYVLHSERLKRRRESLVAWALVRLAATVTRRPNGPPPWISEDSPGGDP